MPGPKPAVPSKPQRLLSSSSIDEKELPIRSHAKSQTAPIGNRGVVKTKRNVQNTANFAEDSAEGPGNEGGEQAGGDAATEASGAESGDENENDKANESEQDEGEESEEGEETPKKKKKPVHPQESIKKFWKNYDPEYQGKLVQVLPDSTPYDTTPKSRPQTSQNSRQSYEEARAACIRDVERIVQECLMVNEKYTDPHFDIERDLKITMQRNCFTSLTREDGDGIPTPADVKRVTDIFEKPVFYADGAGADDIMQGDLGDCWVLAALATLAVNEELLKKVAVVQNVEIGVYGFVFYRDGEWQQTIIDDKLYLRAPSFDEDSEELLERWGVSQENQESKYEELFQRGSKALLFAHCRDENEIWVPLLEKALAKAHGGYDALDGGFSGEAVEDLTGGVTSEIYTTNILNKNRFWQEMRSNGKHFLFGCAMARYKNWRAGDYAESSMLTWGERRKGIIDHHAYSVLDTYEGHGVRLVKVRNPWGQGDKSEWRGKWSDGSAEWTPEWLKRLNHRFGNDGIFWISFEDFLKNYKSIERTRLFDDSWFTAQKWSSVQVPFNTLDYQQTKFTIEVPNDTETVIVLSQLDTRYFRGLEGKYEYTLNFRLSREGDESNYIARSRPLYNMDRSNNVEFPLKQGKYIVLIKIEAADYGRPSPEEVIRRNMPERKEKVITLGRLYDLAHQKGLPELEVEGAVSITGKAEEEIQSGTLKAEMKEEATQTADEAPGTDDVTPESSAADAATGSADVDAAKTAEATAEEEDEEDDEAKDPWNASCVVGLRVYSKLPDLKVGIIQPVKDETRQPTVDNDAITKAAQSEAEKKTAESDEKEDKKKKKQKKKKKKAVKKGGKKDKKEIQAKEEKEAGKSTLAYRSGKKSNQKPDMEEDGSGNDEEEDEDEGHEEPGSAEEEDEEEED